MKVSLASQCGGCPRGGGGASAEPPGASNPFHNPINTLYLTRDYFRHYSGHRSQNLPFYTHHSPPSGLSVIFPQPMLVVKGTRDPGGGENPSFRPTGTAQFPPGKITGDPRSGFSEM